MSFEGVHCNNTIISVYPIKRIAAQRAMFCFIWCQKEQNFAQIDRNIVRIIAEYIWESRREDCWLNWLKK